MDLVVQVILNSVMLSSMYALVAVGLTLVFGVMGIINFAHGELYMLGAFVLWWVCTELSLPFFAGVLLAGVVVGAFGIGLERVLFRPLRASPLTGLIASLGLGMALQVVMLMAFGTSFRRVPIAFPAIVRIAGASIQMQRIVITISGAALLLLLALFLNRTRRGLEIIACAEDREAAALQGMSLNVSSALTMAFGSGLAGIAGALAAPVFAVDPWMGIPVILKAFVIVIVGGAGSVKGAMVTALLLGVIESLLSTFANPTFATVSTLGVLFLVLIAKPEGLFGHA